MSAQLSFPKLDLSTWGTTRNTLQTYAQLLGKIRRALTPFQEKWWHVSLHVDETGLTTTNIPLAGNDGQHFVMQLNLVAHTMLIGLPSGQSHQISLQDQSPKSMLDFSLSRLKLSGIAPDIDQAPFSSSDISAYNAVHAEIFLTALQSVHQAFQQFKQSLPGETSPVQLWPHHFDLSLEWFSGREIDMPEGEEGGDEQIGFGFSTGDETIPEAYFYANPSPFSTEILKTPLPSGASWHTEGWQGGLLPYQFLAESDDPPGLLRAYLDAVYQNASALTK